MLDEFKNLKSDQEEVYQIKAEQDTPIIRDSMRPRRKNNRKTTRGRKTQVIKIQVSNTWPPKFIEKTIKHLYK